MKRDEIIESAAATKEDLKLLSLELKAEIAWLEAGLLKWAIGMQLSFAALILGGVYAMLNHWKP